MPFIATNLTVLSAANGFTLWHYRTTDSRTETEAAGYFTPAADRVRVDDAERNAIRVNGSNKRLDICAFRAELFNPLKDGSAAIHLANVVAGTPNQVHLGTPPLLGNGNGGPLINASTNGFAASAAPAGRVDRPGAMVGSQDTGLFQPGTATISVSAGGAEQMRIASGNISMGGAPGARFRKRCRRHTKPCGKRH